jgi:hypothetical protein
VTNKATQWLFGRAAQAVAAAVLAVITGLWEKYARVATWPEVVAIGLVTFVCLFWMAEKFWRLPWRWQVRQWLDDTGYDVKTVLDDRSEFLFTLTDPIGMKTTILQSKPGVPIFIGVAGLKPTDAQVAIFNAWPEEKRNEFWRAVRMEFMRYRISFSDLKFEGDGVMVSTSVEASPDLTGLEFRRIVLSVRSAARLYLEYLLVIK